MGVTGALLRMVGVAAIPVATFCTCVVLVYVMGALLVAISTPPNRPFEWPFAFLFERVSWLWPALPPKLPLPDVTLQLPDVQARVPLPRAQPTV